MRWAAAYLTILGASVIPAAGQVMLLGPASRPAKPETATLVRLTVRPAAPPKAALKYRLLPELLDQTPGNAAQLYYLGTSVYAEKPELQEKLREWLDLPIDKLPDEQAVATTVLGYSTPLRQIELAARREYCRWELPIRSEGYAMAIPPLHKYRDLAKLLAVRIRFDVAGGRLDAAIHKLQTGMAMGRHLSEGPTLIHALVGTSVTFLMLERAEDLIGAEGGPNLYWALAALPRPYVDLRRGIEYEYSSLYLAFPRLRGLSSARLTGQQWQTLTDDLARDLAGMLGPEGKALRTWRQKTLVTGAAIWAYPQAKEYLLATGRTRQQVEAMPVHQVIATWFLETYEQTTHDLFKWFYVPYWQAREGFRRSEEAADRTRQQHRANILLALVPSLSRAYFLVTKVDRKIAALRCVEAVRMYAAEHGGRLPTKLSDITAVPVPIDPITGKGFGYEAAKNRFLLDAPAPKGESPREGLRYEVTVLRK